MKKLVIIGAGGYAKSVLDSIDYGAYEVVGFLDESSKEKMHLGYPIKWNNFNDIENSSDYYYFIAIGNNNRRKRWFDILKDNNLSLINVIDKTAIISKEATIGEGCFFGKMAIVNSKAIIGDDCIINTRALVEHGCHVSDHVNISTNSVINGDVIVGEGSFVGSSSVTIGQLKIGKWSMVGAGAVVVKDVGDNVTVAGVPAKLIHSNAELG